MNNDIKNLLDRCTPYLFGDEVDKLTKYITNLQDTLKDREEYCYGLETQITNLQEENRLLKMDKLEKQFPNLNAVKVEIDTYKSRNEKAIEHIDLYINRLLDNDIAITPIEMRYLKNILQGENKDE